MADDIDYDSIGEALDVTAAWLLAAYGARLERISLTLEGYFGPLTECYGIVPISLIRGITSDGSPETKETLPSRDVVAHAESLFTRLHPSVRLTHDPGCDVRHVASSTGWAAADVSGHRRLELLRRFGRLDGAA